MNERPSLDEIARSMIQPSQGAPEGAGDITDESSEDERATARDRSAAGSPDGGRDDLGQDEFDDDYTPNRGNRASEKPDEGEEGDPDLDPDRLEEDDDQDDDASSDDRGDDESQNEDDILDGIFATDAELADESSGIDPKLLTDEVMIPVKVDGEDELVSLGDLKKRHAGEGAIQRRLSEATTARQKAFEDYDKTRNLTEAFLKDFGQLMFRRTIPAPDEAMKDSDPQTFIRHKDAYDKEGEALVGMQNKLSGLIGQLEEQQQEQIKEVKREASKRLREIMPVFNDKVKGPKVRKAIVDAALEIGYTKEQISDCVDPYMFKTMALAARELRRQKASKAKRSDQNDRGVTGGRGAAPTRIRKDTPRSQKAERASLEKARKTGSLDDIAASMVVTPPKKGRSRRR